MIIDNDTLIWVCLGALLWWALKGFYRAFSPKKGRRSIRPGDVVRLKSGGPRMVVARYDPSGCWLCVYWPPQKDEYMKGLFSADVLEVL